MIPEGSMGDTLNNSLIVSICADDESGEDSSPVRRPTSFHGKRGVSAGVEPWTVDAVTRRPEASSEGGFSSPRFLRTLSSARGLHLLIESDGSRRNRAS